MNILMAYELQPFNWDSNTAALSHFPAFAPIEIRRRHRNTAT